MSVTRSCLDNHRLKSVRQGGLGEAIKHHKSAMRKIDRTIDPFPDDTIFEGELRWLDSGLEKAIEDEERARLAFLGYRVTNLEDVRAKANHIRLLLAEGDELDRTELELLLLSLI